MTTGQSLSARFEALLLCRFEYFTVTAVDLEHMATARHYNLNLVSTENVCRSHGVVTSNVGRYVIARQHD
jgi:hypothetical protein